MESPTYVYAGSEGLSALIALAASMSHDLASRLKADPNISIEFDAEVTALHGTHHLEAVTVRNANTNTTRVVDTGAVFIVVGASPNTEWLSGLVNLDDKGFVTWVHWVSTISTPTTMRALRTVLS